MVMLGNTNVTRVRRKEKKKYERARIAPNPRLSTLFIRLRNSDSTVRARVFLSVCVYDKIVHIYIYVNPLFVFPDPDKPEGYDEPHSQQTRISKWSIVKTKVYFWSDSYNACARTISSTGFHLRGCLPALCRGIRIEYTWINLKTAGRSNFTSRHLSN